MPITWRNVNGPSFNGVSESLARAGQSFGGAIDALQQTKDTFETGRTNRNTEEFMAQLSKYGSPDELAAAQESGAVADLRRQFGSLLNTNKTSADAITGRIGTLRDRETADFNYDQTAMKREQDPIIRQAKLAIAQNDDESYKRIMSENPDLYQAPELANQFTQAERGRLEQGRSDRTYNQKTTMNNLVRQYANASGDKSDTLSVRAFEADARAKGLDEEYITQGIQLMSGGFDRGNQLYGDDKRAYDKEVSGLKSQYNIGRSAFNDWENTNPIEDASNLIDDFTDKETGFLFGMGDNEGRSKIINEVTTAMRDGVTLSSGDTVPITKQVAKLALQGVRGGSWDFDSTFQTQVEKLVRDGSLQKDFENYTDFKSALTNLETNKMQTVLNRARGESPANSPPALLSREALPYTGDTSVKGAVKQLQNEAPVVQSNLPEPAAQSQPESGGGVPYPLRPNPGTEGLPTSVSSALAALDSAGVPPGTPLPQKGQEPVPVEAPYSQPFLQTPIRKLPGQFKDWFNETVNANAVESGKRGAEVLRSLMDQRTPIPEIEMRERLTTNPFALKQLDAKELNKLRDIYGESFINQFIK